MLSVYLFILILGVDGSGKSCDDIDHEACIAMAKQNSLMCSDAVLATSVCPNFCNHCRKYGLCKYPNKDTSIVIYRCLLSLKGLIYS